MCMMNQPDIPPPTPVVERQGARAPDGAAATSAAGRRTMDRVRAGSNTVLTSGGGVMQQAQTQGKTLLGQ